MLVQRGVIKGVSAVGKPSKGKKPNKDSSGEEMFSFNGSMYPVKDRDKVILEFSRELNASYGFDLDEYDED